MNERQKREDEGRKGEDAGAEGRGGRERKIFLVVIVNCILDKCTLITGTLYCSGQATHSTPSSPISSGTTMLPRA